MIVILHPDSSLDTDEGKAVLSYLSTKSGITPRTHSITGADRTLSEIYVIGDVGALDQAEIESLPGVEKVVRHLTHLPVCIDPSHSVGTRNVGPDGISDLMHATAQGVIAGANTVLVDFHPRPDEALVDGPQALRPDELSWFFEDVATARQAYEARLTRAHEYNVSTES